jgi:hypothetical protein
MIDMVWPPPGSFTGGAALDHLVRNCQPESRHLLLNLLGDNVVLDLVVGGLGNDLLLHQLILPGIGPVLEVLFEYASPIPGRAFNSSSDAVLRSNGAFLGAAGLAGCLVSVFTGSFAA